MKIEKNIKNGELSNKNKILDSSFKILETDTSFETNEKYSDFNFMNKRNKRYKNIKFNNMKNKIRLIFNLVGFILFIIIITEIILKIILKKHISKFEVAIVLLYLIVYSILLYNFLKKGKKFIINAIFNKDNKAQDNILIDEENLDKKDIINLNKIKLLSNITKDSYNHWCSDNSFIVFKSIDNIIYIIYSNEFKSIICFDLEQTKKTCEIRNAHTEYINSFNYFYDIKNKKDIVMSVSCLDNNIKLWDANIWECILNLKKVNDIGMIFSACFIYDKRQDYKFIVSSNYVLFFNSGPIKIFDFNGTKIKELNDSEKDVCFIDTYYEQKSSINYIISGNNDSVYSYDFVHNKLYNKYDDNDNKNHRNIIIKEYQNTVKLIESCDDGNIRIWNFHNAILLNKIKVNDNPLNGICLWENDYLFVGCRENPIKLVNLKNGKIVISLKGHYSNISTIKKINHPLYGKCLLSQGWLKDQIKIWKENI